MSVHSSMSGWLAEIRARVARAAALEEAGKCRRGMVPVYGDAEWLARLRAELTDAEWSQIDICAKPSFLDSISRTPCCMPGTLMWGEWGEKP